MWIDGVFHELINVLLLLMQSMGPTQVAGFAPGSTTSALIAGLEGPQRPVAAMVVGRRR